MADECDFVPKLSGITPATWKARVINDDWCAHHGDNYGASISHRASGLKAFTFGCQDPDAIAEAAKVCDPPGVAPGTDGQFSWSERHEVVAWLSRVAAKVGASWDDMVRLSDAMVRSGRKPA